MKRIVAKTNSLFFFGDELSGLTPGDSSAATDRSAQNSDFTIAALQYPQDVFVAGEVIRSLPQVLASYACRNAKPLLSYYT